MKSIKLWIDDQEVTAASGKTIMEAADEAGIYIPRLCYHKFLEPSGSCRLCAVEIEGCRGLPASCTTPVAEGMRVKTTSPKVQEFRREMLRLILVDHPRECLGCPRNGECELQQLVRKVGIEFPYQTSAIERPPAKPAGSYFERDYSLCVRCGRCVRACHEIRGAKAIVFREVRGRQEVSTAFEMPLEEAGCQFCGACLDVCPVGALRERMEFNGLDGFENMFQFCENLTNIIATLYKKESPRTTTPSLCTFCSAGCAMIFEQSGAGDIIQVRPDPNGPTNRGQACVRGRFFLKKYLQNPDRLKRPLKRKDNSYEEIPMEEALDFVSEKFKAYGSGRIAVLTDAQATNEELYLMQKFARSVLGTNAVGYIGASGVLASSEALRENLGVMAATGSFGGLTNTGCMLAIGLHPAASHPIGEVYVRRAVLKGAKLVVASPFKEALARYADVHLAHYPGTEPVLLAGIMRLLLKGRDENPSLRCQYPAELAELRKRLEPYHLEKVSKITGVSQEDITESTHLIGTAPVLSILYGLGVVKNYHAAEITRALVTLFHLKGGLEKEGGAIAPLFGDGNYQGMWDMGMLPHILPGQIKNGDVPQHVEILEEISSGKIRAAYIALETFDSSSLDYLRPYLEKLEFVVVHDVRMPDIKADIILPMAVALEKGGTFTNSERRIQAIQPILRPPAEAKSIQWILKELSDRMGNTDFSYDSNEEVWEEIKREVSLYRGIGRDDLPTQWPCLEDQHPGTKIFFRDQSPLWAPWKPQPLEEPEDFPNEEYPFALIGKKALKNYFLGPLLAKETVQLFEGDGAIEVNPADGCAMGLTPGEIVKVITPKGELKGPLVMSRVLPTKVVTAPERDLKILLGESCHDCKTLAARLAKADSY
jgi:predicted molibdopterin-dependent oxidoreductase YjgC